MKRFQRKMVRRYLFTELLCELLAGQSPRGRASCVHLCCLQVQPWRASLCLRAVLFRYTFSQLNDREQKQLDEHLQSLGVLEDQRSLHVSMRLRSQDTDGEGDARVEAMLLERRF